MAVDNIVPLRNLNNGGVVIDSNPYALSQIEFSDCRNVRFHDRSVRKITGEEDMLEVDNSGIINIEYWRQPTITRYIYTNDSGNTYLKNVTGTDTNITGTEGLSGTAQITGGLFNGGATYVINDGTTIPKYINASGSGSATQALVNLPNWDYDSAIFSSVRAEVLRPYRNVLVAANLTYTGTNNSLTYAPGTIRVSNLAARGEIPTWDPQAAAATTADEQDLSTNDPIVDMVPFQNRLLVYCTNSVHSITLTGSSTTPVAYSQELSGRGLLSANCAVEFYGRHFVVGNDDIYLYGGGAQVSSVSDEKIRDYFYSNLNMAEAELTFCVHNQNQDEIWVCYAKGTSTTANEALIFNYVHNTWSIRDLPNVTTGTSGVLVDDFTTPTSFLNNNLNIIIASTDTLIAVDRGTSFSGGAINSYIERKGFDVSPDNDLQQFHTKSVYLTATGTGELDVRVEAQNSPGQVVDLTRRPDRHLQQRTFDLDGANSDYKIDPNITGRYFNYRIGSNDADDTWTLVEIQITTQATNAR